MPIFFNGHFTGTQVCQIYKKDAQYMQTIYGYLKLFVAVVFCCRRFRVAPGTLCIPFIPLPPSVLKRCFQCRTQRILGSHPGRRRLCRSGSASDAHSNWDHHPGHQDAGGPRWEGSSNSWADGTGPEAFRFPWAPRFCSKKTSFSFLIHVRTNNYWGNMRKASRIKEIHYKYKRFLYVFQPSEH